MIIFIELVKRVSILHEKFFIYSKHFTNNTILITPYQTTKQPNKQYKLTNSPNKQYFRILSEYKHTKQTTKQPNRPPNPLT